MKIAFVIIKKMRLICLLTLEAIDIVVLHIFFFRPNSLQFFLQLRFLNCWHTAPYELASCQEYCCFRYP